MNLLVGIRFAFCCPPPNVERLGWGMLVLGLGIANPWRAFLSWDVFAKTG